MPTPPIDILIGDVVQTRKGHPCGGNTWRVVRVGAEIGMRCLTCDRKVMLPRATFERRIKRFVSRGDAGATAEPDPQF
ncbi:MAG: DUF951 domain-containing protein [Roseiflexaceae bacterium]